MTRFNQILLLGCALVALVACDKGAPAPSDMNDGGPEVKNRVGKPDVTPGGRTERGKAPSTQ